MMHTKKKKKNERELNDSSEQLTTVKSCVSGEF